MFQALLSPKLILYFGYINNLDVDLQARLNPLIIRFNRKVGIAYINKLKNPNNLITYQIVYFLSFVISILCHLY